jgi:hypothetical protein
MEDIIQNNIVYFGDFMCLNRSINDTELEQTEYHFNSFVLIIQCYSRHNGWRT